MYEAISYGVAQLVPNVVAQISGFIALCDEKGKVPSVRLFFSIYEVRYYNGQVYFDTRNKRLKIVSVRSSNSGYHSKWLYFYGPDLEFVRPCQKVTSVTIDYLNRLDKNDEEYLNSFHWSMSVYNHLQLKELRFLESHDRKIM